MSHIISEGLLILTQSAAKSMGHNQQFERPDGRRFVDSNIHSGPAWQLWGAFDNYIIPLLPKPYRSKTGAESKTIEGNAVATVKWSVCFIEAK
jgi:hypothetical protein